MALREGLPGTIYRKDYQAPAFGIETVDLLVQIEEGRTLVTATLDVTRRQSGVAPLTLDGEQLELEWVELDGVRLESTQYGVTDTQLVIASVSDRFTLRTRVIINPEENTSLEGFYRSQSAYCTQCEAEGFRKITYFLDRPDVLATYTVTLEADQSQCPVLLSNGNLVEEQSLENGRHRAVWHDPFPKPSYLFAMVAGDLNAVRDTSSRCQASLSIY